MTTQIVHNKISFKNMLVFGMNRLDEILLELYQKVSDGNLLVWLSVHVYNYNVTEPSLPNRGRNCLIQQDALFNA